MDLHVIGPLASAGRACGRRRRARPAGVGLGRRPRDSGADGHAARGGHATRSRRSLLLPALHAVQVADRLDQPAGAQLHLPAAGRAAGRGLRRRDVLRAVRARRRGRRVVAHVCDDIACRLAGRGGDLRGPERALGPAGRAGPRRPSDLAAQPVPRAVRPRAGGAGHGRRRGAARRARRRRSTPPAVARRCSTGGRPAPADLPRRVPQAGDPAAAPARAASASSTRRRSTTTAPTAATRRCAARSRSGPEARHRARSRDSKLVGRGGAAFPTGRKWAAVAAPARPAALPRLQRRRVRARHVQGPRPAWRATRSRSSRR